MAIDLQITDGVSSSISTKLDSIAKSAGAAETNVEALIKRLNSLDTSKLKAVNKAAIDASKVEVNAARTSYYNAKEKVELARYKTEAAKAAQVDAARYNQFAVNSQKQATQKVMDAEKIAQQKLMTAEKSAKAAAVQAEALTRQAAANVKTQYQNQLLQYTGNWADQDNKLKNLRTQQGQAQLGVVQARQDEILNRTLLTQQKLSTEVNRGAKEAANAAVSQQRLATETARTATANTTAATAQERLTAAQARANAAVARSNASIASSTSRLNALNAAGRSGASGVRDLGSAMSYLESSSSFLRSDGLRWAKVLWALSGATLTAGAIVQAADAYTLLQNRLSVVADDQAHVNKLTEEMFEIASRSRQPVADVGKAFTRFDMAMRDMGRSQQDTIRVTETVGKALQMSGATAGEAASSLLQLSQAFNKGKLDGDEFRSVMENAPLIADAFAKELNVTRGELLKLAPAGKLTVDQLVKSILNSEEKINGMFDNFKWTIGQSFTYLRNEMTRFFGELDSQVGFTQAFAAGIRVVVDNLDTLLFVLLAATPALALFVGAKTLGGLKLLSGFMLNAGRSIGAMRSPITVVAASLNGMINRGIVAGTTLNTMFASSTARAVGFQLAVVRASAAVAGLGAAAARAGTAMFAAFSFGNIVLLIGTLIAAAIAFGDKLELAGEKSYTLRDYTLAALTETWNFVKFVFESIYDFIAAMFGASAKEGMTFGEKVKSTFETVVMFGAAMVDSLTQVLKILWTGVKLAIAAVADGVRAIIWAAVNSVVAFINTAIDALNGLMSFANSILAATGADTIVGTFGQIGRVAGMEFESGIRNIIENTDFGMETAAMDAASTYLSRVEDAAIARNKKQEAAAGLREYDPEKAARAAAAQKAAEKDKKKKDKKPKKSDEEKRADIIEKAMNAEKKAIEVARNYGDERERVSVIEGVNNKLREKGYAILSAGEESSLRALIDQRLEAERVGAALQSMYEEAVNPQREYVAAQKAAHILMQDGILTAEKYAGKMNKIAESYAEATDAAYSLKKQLSDIEHKDYGTFGKYGVDAEIAKNQKTAFDKDGYLNPAKAAEIDALTRSLYNLQKVQETSKQLWDDTYGVQENIGFQIDAVSSAYDNGVISIESYVRKLAELKAQQGAVSEVMNGATNPFEPIERGFNQLVANMPTLGQSMADTIESTLGNAIDNVSTMLTEMALNFDAYAEKIADTLERPVSTLDVLRYAFSDLIKQIGTELIGAIIKMGVQWAIQAALSKTIEAESAAATIATQTATATAVAAAWEPAALAASVATMGDAAIVGLASYTAAKADNAGFSFLPGFADGGEIVGRGTGRSDSIVARLSAGEHVVRAGPAEKHRALLNAMNNGQEINSGGAKLDTNVNIYITPSGVSSDGTGDKALTKEVRAQMEQAAYKVYVSMQKQGQMGYKP